MRKTLSSSWRMPSICEESIWPLPRRTPSINKKPSSNPDGSGSKNRRARQNSMGTNVREPSTVKEITAQYALFMGVNKIGS